MLAEKVARIVFDEFNVDVTYRDVVINGMRYTNKAFVPFLEETFIGDLLVTYKLEKEMLDGSLRSSYPSVLKYLKQIVEKDRLTQKEADASREAEEALVGLDEDLAKILDNTYLGCDYSTGDSFFVSKLDNSVVQKISPKFIKSNVPIKTWNAISKDTRTVFLGFDPYKEELDPVDVMGVKVPKVNTYNKPQWRHSDRLEVSEVTYILDLIKIVIPKKEDREFFLSFAKNLITDRPKTYLVMTGTQGTGKGTMAKILSALVGSGNSQSASGHIVTNNFNGFLKYAQFAHLEEFSCAKREEQRNVLKRMVEDTVQIDAKFVNQETIKNNCGFMISNNSLSAVPIYPGDRRFSVMVTTSQRLEETFSSKEIDDLVDNILVEGSDHMASFGNWLLQQTVKFTPNEQYRSHALERAHRASCHRLIGEIINNLLSEDSPVAYEVKFSEIETVADSRRTRFGFHLSDFYNFFELFTWHSEKICEVSYIDNESDCLVRKI